MNNWIKRLKERLTLTKNKKGESEIKVKIVADGWILKKNGKTEYIRR